jgi:hypothetical protein
MSNQFSTNLQWSTMKAVATGMKNLPRWSVIAVALLVLTASAHAQKHPSCSCDASCTTHNNCLLVSDLGSNQVEQYDDYGCLCNATFLQGGPSDPGGEGLTCSSGTANQLVTSNNGTELNVFNLTTGHYTGTQFIVPGASSIAALSVNALGTTLYAADYGANQLYSMDLNPLGSNLQTVASRYSHDVSVGYSGYIYATQFFTPPPPPGGIEQYNPDFTGAVNFIANQCWIFVNGDGQQHCTYRVSGMAWDANGYLWVSSDAGAPDEDGVFQFAVGPTGQLLNGGVPLNFTPDTNCSSGNCEPIGVDVAPPDALQYAGNIVVANFSGDSVVRIDPTTCLGNLTNGGLGMCTAVAFLTPPGGNPKYPKYTHSCSSTGNNGYLEICKQTDPVRRVSGIFDFVATAPFFNSGVIEVPVGECSGAIAAPAGTVTLTEAPAIGGAVSNISAYGYNQNGYKVNRLLSSNIPNQTANVTVVQGGINLETVATFTNYAPPPGTLKVCKIAGPGVTVGTPFTFNITGLRPIQIEAGPADQGGFCSVVGSFPYNTQETVAEVVPPGISVSNITVTPANRGSDQTPNSVVATIGTGITEVDFTDASVPLGSCQASESLSVLLINGTNVVAYVPEANWGGGNPGVAVVNVEGNYLASPVIVPTGNDLINSCASDPSLGETVCASNGDPTLNTSNVYVIKGNPPAVAAIVPSGGTGQIGFSGGDCTNCSVAMDAVTHKAVIGLSIAGVGGYQFFDLASNTFESALIPSPIGHISEDPLIDPISTPPLLLSASEGIYGGPGNYEIADITNTLSPVFYENPIGNGAGGDGPDSSAEDCSSRIAMTPTEGSTPTQLYVADLNAAHFTVGSPAGTWTDASSQFFSLTNSDLTSTGDNGPIAVAQGGSHEGVLGQEFGRNTPNGNVITAFKLNVPYNGGAPFSNWITCNLGNNFVQGDDPHTITAYQSPNGAKHSFAVIANEAPASSLAVVDLDMMLALPATTTPHVCDAGTLPSNVVRFITPLSQHSHF